MDNKINQKASTSLNSSTIDIQKLSNGDIQEQLKLAFQLDESAVKAAFSDVGVQINGYNDIAFLANLSRTKSDEAGVLKNRFGHPIIFSVKKTLSNVKSDFSSLLNQKRLSLKWK